MNLDEVSAAVAWEIENLSSQLKEIHSTFTKIKVSEVKELEMHFSDGNYMMTLEFRRGSPTRNILEHLEDVIFGEEESYDEHEFIIDDDEEGSEFKDPYEIVVADLLASELDSADDQLE